MVVMEVIKCKWYVAMYLHPLLPSPDSVFQDNASPRKRILDKELFPIPGNPVDTASVVRLRVRYQEAKFWPVHCTKHCMVVYPDFGMVKQKIEFRIYETTFLKKKILL